MTVEAKMELVPQFLYQNSSNQSFQVSTNYPILNGDTSLIPSTSAFSTSKGFALLKALHLVLRCIDYTNWDIRQIDARIAIVVQELNELKEKKKDKMLKLKFMQHFIAPYFCDARQRYPPLNSVCKEKIARKDFDAYWTLAIPWTTVERKVLLTFIHEVAEDSVLKPICAKQSFLENKLSTSIADEVEREETEQKIEKLRRKAIKIKDLPFEEILMHPNCNLDWLLISCKLENLRCTRTPNECEQIWNNLLNPDINKKIFAKPEDKKLKRLAIIYDEKNWKIIAKELRTDRTAIQCLTRYQRYLNKELTRKYWTVEEDYQLRYHVENLIIGDYIPWTRVFAFMPGKSFRKVRERWERCLKPQKKYSWTAEEDAILLLAYAVLKQPLWTKMSKLLYGRNYISCKQRYVNILNPDVLTGDWSEKEDRKLVQCLADYGEKWTAISRHFPERTCTMVRCRSLMIKKHRSYIYANILRKGLKIRRYPKKQLVPSKIRTEVNAMREKIRNNAFILAKTAAEKVLGSKIDFSNCHKFDDFHGLINEVSLELIAAELLPECNEELKPPLRIYYHPPKFQSSEVESSSEDYSSFESDEEDDCDIIMEDIELMRDDIYFDDYEYDHLQLPKDFDLEAFNIEFDRRILPNAEMKNYEHGINFKFLKRYITYSVLVRHIFQLYHINVPQEYVINDASTAINDISTLFYTVDYGKVIPPIMDAFVIANNGELSLPIMPPNIRTIKGAKMLLMIYGHLKEWMENLDEQGCHIFNSFVARASNGKILCTYCTDRLKCEIHNEKTNENVKMDDKEESLCTCKVVLETRQKFLTFLYRMTVFFLWPLFLCSKKPTPEQLLNLVVIPKRIRRENRARNAENRKRKKPRHCYSDPEISEYEDDDDEDYIPYEDDDDEDYIPYGDDDD